MKSFLRAFPPPMKNKIYFAIWLCTYVLQSNLFLIFIWILNQPGLQERYFLKMDFSVFKCRLLAPVGIFRINNRWFCILEYILRTMSDFHDFGLTWKCQKIFPCCCTITSKNIINVFWNFFFTLLAPSWPLRSKKFQKTLISAFEANSALSHENETKIVKITHSAVKYVGVKRIQT